MSLREKLNDWRFNLIIHPQACYFFRIFPYGYVRHTLYSPTTFSNFRISRLSKRRGKKREEKESSNYVRNDFVSRNLIRIVHIEIEGFFESVARSFQSLHRGSVRSVRREARVLRGPKGWLMNGQLIHENHRRVVLGARVLRYTAKPPKIQPSTIPYTVLFKECPSPTPFLSLFPSL